MLEKNSDLQNEKIEIFWKKVLGILQTELNPMTFNMWVLKVKPENLKENSIDLVISMPYIRKQLEKYESLIQNAVDKVGRQKFIVNYVIRKDVLDKNEEIQTYGPLFTREPANKNINNHQYKTGLTPRYTFENFILGSSNQLAYAIAQAVSENPGETYNPFFLYSESGLGKTHLVQALGNRILDKNPNCILIYTTGEAFMNELIEVIQSGKIKGKYASNEFRNKYRKVDVLIIDDIQTIIGKDSTQNEFFHTFNTLHLAGKQIILTSDRPPKEFTTLEKRITSRFGSGIISDIQQPDAELRIAILRNKRDTNKDQVSNEVIESIASSVETNIRELEGAYLQVITEAKKDGKLPTVDIVNKVINKNSTEKKKAVNANSILKTICQFYSVRASDIKGKRRTKDLVLPRQVAMYLIKEMTDFPLMGIGEFLGGRDHTTIMHGIRKMEAEIKAAGKVKKDILSVKKLL
ncbi:hypothetical protein A2V49_04430 [candidate division WWE3 bacterium RBG_19FT_COMBO_34_6]|uniref:Chromosomal replication initiator protein DnaA n=1 Tax=candidate division WWE3 bacterium RBG_19FT_COMBO_34_6 TaxID=1802612 RepID=A0A1F4UMN4_UNCKA|nr:MAG: hypothetical protein A2V49_04430 [candidate division WWE3 bacterium RBG_19FT_COMBO_34_6]